MEKLINLLTVFGLVFIMSGFIQYFIPTKINGFWGLRTNKTIRTPETWKYGQKIFSIIQIVLGFILIVFGVHKDDLTTYRIIAPMGLIGYWLLVRFVADKMISKRFPEL